MSTIKIRFTETKSGIPLIKFYSNSKTFYAVIDTGSEMTVFDSSFIDTMVNLEDEFECSVNGLASSVSSCVFRKVKMPFVVKGTNDESIVLFFDGYTTKINELSLKSKHCRELKISSIIGTDILNSYNAKINYEDRTIEMTI